MPLDERDSLLMLVQLTQGIRQGFRQTFVWDLPQHDGAILVTAGDQVVVEWGPGDVDDRGLVTDDLGAVHV